MSPASLLFKPAIIRNDLLPSSAKSFMFFAVGMSFLFRAAAYFLSSDPKAITASHDWTYHAFWLPLHLLLARYSAVVFSKNVQACLDASRESVKPELLARVRSVTSFKGWLVGCLLVAPFIFLDAYAGIDYVRSNVETQRHAAILIPLIWLIEWLATAQIWLYVLGAITTNTIALSNRNLMHRHEEILIGGAVRAPLQSGVESAFITLVYGLSTIGYVWYADGQLSDYMVLGISTVLVLVCFFAALVQMKGVLRRSLDSELLAWQQVVLSSRAAMAAKAEHRNVPYADFKEAVAMVFERKVARNNKLEEHLRLMRLATMLGMPAAANTVPEDAYARSLLLIECETRYFEFGVGEIKALSLRAVMPLFVIVGKSASGLLGAH
jgi:hypothetical protein